MKWDKLFSGGVAGIGATINYIYGGIDMALQTLLLLMALDYISGLLCASKNKTLSSSIGFEGLKKKFIILVIVALSVQIDKVTGASGLARNLVIFFYAGMEGISILENASRAGVPVPEKLKEMLIQLKEGNKKEIIKAKEDTNVLK